MLARLFAVLYLSTVFSVSPLFGQWRPVNPEDVSLKKSKLDPNADAEALFHEIKILNEAASFGYPHNVITEYVRLKIFTDHGKDKYANVQIPYWGKSIISNVEGRTIRPDGTIIELKKQDIFDKVTENNSGFKSKIVSFALPGVTPGAIVEYRWTKNVGEYISRYIPVDVQSEYPVDEVTLRVKPVSSQWVNWPEMRFMPFGCKPERIMQDVGGFSMIALRDVPAFHEEPWMPPQRSVRQWILIYYEENTNVGKDKYWNSLGRQLYGEYSSKIKVNGEVKGIAQEVTAGAASDDEKINRLVEYCRKNLKDIHGDEITTEQREAAKKPNTTTLDTLRRKEGTVRDINLAFAALALGAGFEARLAKISDRENFLFTPAFQSEFFLNTYDIAVKVNGRWKFYDVTNSDVAPGELAWQEQGVYALITDAKEPELIKTPILSSKESTVERIASMNLSAEGVLEADIRELYYGNKAIEWRERFGKANDAEREESLRDDLKHRFSDFGLSKTRFSVPTDLIKPIGLTYHIVVRNYAQRTGKRLFVTPEYFQLGYGNRFTDSVRTQPIYFEYPWSELDNIELQLPEGFELDHADAPGGVNFAPIGSFNVNMSITKTNKLLYRRQLAFGSDSVLLFGADSYPTLKQIFDRVHDADSHLLTLKAETQSAQLQ